MEAWAASTGPFRPTSRCEPPSTPICATAQCLAGDAGRVGRVGWSLDMVGLLVQLVLQRPALSRADELTQRNVWLAAGLLAGLAAGFAHGQVDAFLTLPDLAGWNWVALALLAQMTRLLRPENRRAARRHLPPDGPAERRKLSSYWMRTLICTSGARTSGKSRCSTVAGDQDR
ncbi:MAG: hypothetical protein R2838_19515 [Caldilineaceae bacterium]